MFKRTQPQWHVQNQTADSVLLQLALPQDLDYFEGHFPEVPVLPGVVQMKWAHEKALEYFHLSTELDHLSAVKFQHLQRPGQQLMLQLERLDANKIRFEYFCQEKRYSSGKMVFSS